MKFFTLSSVFTLLLISFTWSGLAQKSDSIPGPRSLPSQFLNEVVVTANRYGSISTKTPEAVRVLGSRSIERSQLRSAPEALSLTPGVFVQKTNHGGGSPFLRGLTGNQTLLLIDGIRLSNAIARYGPNQYFNTIDVFSLEKIEVLRGSGSVQYGSDAIGGTIQAFSLDAEISENPLVGSTVLTRFHTQGMEQSIRAGVAYSGSRAAFRGGASWRNFGDIVGGDTTGKQTPTGYRELDFDLKGKVSLNKFTNATLAFQRVNQSDVPVYHKIALENYSVNKMDPQRRELGYLRINRKIGVGIFKTAVVTASFQNFAEVRELQKNRSSILRIESDKVTSSGFSAEAQASSSKGWSSNNGLEVYHDIVRSNRIDTDQQSGSAVSKRGLYPDGSTMTSMAAFSIHSLDLAGWILSAGVRFNSFIIDVPDESAGKTRITPSALVGNAAIMRKLDKRSNLFISANTGFRAPNIDDLGTLGIVDFRYETPNMDLKPEHSFQYQLGYKFQGSKLSGEIYIYRNELYDLIVRNKIPGDTIEGYPVYMKENVERAYIHGFETAWDYKFNSSWKVSGNITYTYGQNITKNEPVRRIPPLFGRLALDYSIKAWWISLEWQATAEQSRLSTGDRDDNRIPEGGTPGWNVFNISTSYEMRHFNADLTLINLFDTDYRYHGSGLNGYGRSLLLTLKISL
jgi:hemoglobin/transferrin/lactoferrin receptor protein